MAHLRRRRAIELVRGFASGDAEAMLTVSSLAAILAMAPDAVAGGTDDGMKVLPCRPTISCSADIVPTGALEIEVGYAARRVRPDGFFHVQPLLLKLTVLRWLQVQVGTNGYVFTSGDVSKSLQYIDDVSIGLKTHFVDQGALTPSLAASAALSIPTPYRNDTFPFAYDASFWAYASKDVGPVHVDLNGGINLWQFDIDQRSVQPFISLAASVALPLGLGAMAEGYWFDDGGPIALRDSGLLVAASYGPSRRVLFDAGIDWSFVPTTRTYTLFAGVTFIPVRLWGGD
jgi:hypothetical protein